MTPDEAQALADRILAAIEGDDALSHGYGWHTEADLERVASDLAGLSQCEVDLCGDDADGHARRYADGLLRTASLYGVTA